MKTIKNTLRRNNKPTRIVLVHEVGAPVPVTPLGPEPPSYGPGVGPVEVLGVVPERRLGCGQLVGLVQYLFFFFNFNISIMKAKSMKVTIKQRQCLNLQITGTLAILCTVLIRTFIYSFIINVMES